MPAIHRCSSRKPRNSRRVASAIALLVPPSVMSLLARWQVLLSHHWQGQSLSNGEVIGWTIEVLRS